LSEGGEEKLVQLLREIDPRLQKFRYLTAPGTNQPLVYAYFAGLKKAQSITQTGQGFSKLFSLFCQMLASKAEVLLIDEIENGLYYETMPQIWKGIATLAESENIQVFATTHSRECLIAAHETMKAQPSYDFALHRLQRVNGQLESVTHDQGMLEVALKSGMEVR
jgi:AAA15 family ATPase/GTPase